jgi:hypothetical protein
MKNRNKFAIFALVISISGFSIAQAQQFEVSILEKTMKTAESGSSTDRQKEATSTELDNDRGSSAADTKGELMSEAHRSAVATFVKSLLNMADQENGIGRDLNEIAQEQSNSAATTTSAIEKIEGRNSIRTFFFGDDYKNLGVIRSGLATTNNNINNLRIILEQTNNEANRAEINNQIKTLETEQIKLENYVITHENTFSLFGWFNKFFTK